MKLNNIAYHFFAVIFLMTICSCHSGQKEKVDGTIVNIPVSADGASQKDKVPIISFENTSHDFGRLMQGEKVSYTYKFTNTGNATLIISSVVPSCGCTVAQFTKTPIQPGQSGSVSINFNTETKKGNVKSGVVVQANTYPSETKLSFSAVVNN